MAPDGIAPSVLLQAVSDNTRLRLLRLLNRDELNVRELVRILRMSQPRVSKHLAVLKDAGWLKQRKEGTWSWYRATGRAGFSAGPSLYDSVLAQTDRAEWQHEDDLALATVLAERETRSREFFSGVAGRWDQIRQAYAHPDLQLGALTALVEQRPRVVDIGTGTGALLPLLAEVADRVVAVDNSAPMLAAARKLCAKSGLLNVRFHQADIQALPFADACFDAAYCSMVLHHVARPSVAVAEMARVLRPGGKVVLIAFTPHNLDWMRKELAHHRLGFDREETERLCLQAGLQPGRYMVRKPSHELDSIDNKPTRRRGRTLVWPDVFMLVATRPPDPGRKNVQRDKRER